MFPFRIGIQNRSLVNFGYDNATKFDCMTEKAPERGLFLCRGSREGLRVFSFFGREQARACLKKQTLFPHDAPLIPPSTGNKQSL